MNNKRILLLFPFLLLMTIVIAQTSERGFSFQGYAIDPDGKALSSTGVTARFTIYNKANSAQSYTEEQSFTTDLYGVFAAVVGSVTSSDFKKLNFTTKDADYWMKVEVKKSAGGSYTTISDARMQAVPYARHADNGVPVGTIVPFAGPKTKIPIGWLFCDGSAKDGSDPGFQQLYDVLGNSWGGSGTSFNLPDLRGQFLRGVNDGSGNDPDAGSRVAKHGGSNAGDLVGSYQGDTFGSHNHAMSAAGIHSHGANPNGPSYNGFVVRNGANTNAHATDGSPANNEINLNWADRFVPDGNHTHHIHHAGGNETRPKNAGVYYIIKY